mmetsp:Transcript_8107/g.10960  ORF Transcript_8107/g.10960 Transcript_8107/m.10960 type:complete len:204 (-) Transcript_8107:267-878(-)
MCLHVFISDHDTRNFHIIKVSDVSLPDGGEELVKGEAPLQIIGVLRHHVLGVALLEKRLVSIHRVAHHQQNHVRSLSEYRSNVLIRFVTLDENRVVAHAWFDRRALFGGRGNYHRFIGGVYWNATTCWGECASARTQRESWTNGATFSHHSSDSFPQFAKVNTTRLRHCREINTKEIALRASDILWNGGGFKPDSTNRLIFIF